VSDLRLAKSAVTEVETLAEDEVDMTIVQKQEVTFEELVDLSQSTVVEEAKVDIEESVEQTEKVQTEGNLSKPASCWLSNQVQIIGYVTFIKYIGLSFTTLIELLAQRVTQSCELIVKL